MSTLSVHVCLTSGKYAKNRMDSEDLNEQNIHQKTFKIRLHE